jgi:DNA-binding PadR family transcriptional regulator
MVRRAAPGPERRPAATATEQPSPLTSTAASLLGFLHEGEMSGWDLVVKVETTIGDFWNITKSQVYRELEALARAGFVKQGNVGPRARRAYALTSRGRAAFATWISAPPGPILMRWPLALTMYFGKYVDDAKLREVVAVQRARHAATLTTLRGLRSVVRAPAGDPHVAAVLELGIGFHQLVIEWLDTVARDTTLVAAKRPGRRVRSPDRAPRRGDR